jgi:hypothetical protein
MRFPIALVALALLVPALLLVTGSGSRSVQAEEPADPLAALVHDVAVLKERQAAIRGYVLANAARADRIDQLVADLRRLGFAAAANPAAARERLLAGLSEMAKSMREGLPAK